MPAAVAAVYVLLAVVTVAVAVVALTVGLLGELGERLAAAGWAGATTLRSAYHGRGATP